MFISNLKKKKKIRNGICGNILNMDTQSMHVLRDIMETSIRRFSFINKDVGIDEMREKCLAKDPETLEFLVTVLIDAQRNVDISTVESIIRAHIQCGFLEKVGYVSNSLHRLCCYIDRQWEIRAIDIARMPKDDF